VGLALGVVVSAGCASTITVPPLTSEEAIRLEEAGNFPHRTYRIEPGDTIIVEYAYHPEMKQEERVRPDGTITASHVGEINVGGMTTTALADLLVARTSDRLRDPVVTVRVTHFNEKQVYVGGEVGKPGPILYQRGLTPLQAIIAAGGFRDTARIDSVILIRRGWAGEGFLSRKLNITETVTAGAREPLHLAPHDVLFVPRTGIAEVDIWVRQHITEIVPFIRLSPLTP